MPVSQLVSFGVWLAAALIGAVVLLYVWERLRARYERDR